MVIIETEPNQIASELATELWKNTGRELSLMNGKRREGEKLMRRKFKHNFRGFRRFICKFGSGFKLSHVLQK